MKLNGIIRKLDDLNRVALPVEICNRLGFKNSEKLLIVANQDHIEIHKAMNTCVFCGNDCETDLIEHNGVYVCYMCAGIIENKAKVDTVQNAERGSISMGMSI